MSEPHKLVQGVDAHVFTDEDRSRGGRARAEKIRAENAARGKTTRRRRRSRSKWAGYRDKFDTPEYRARVAAAQAAAPVHPAARGGVPMGPGLDDYDEARALSKERGGIRMDLWAMRRARERADLIDP